MKKKLLFLMITSSILFSSIITGFAESVTNPVAAEENFTIKNILGSFFNSNSAIIAAVVSAVLLILLLIFNKRIKRKLDNTTASHMINAFIIFFSVSGIACLAMGFATEGATWSNLMHFNENISDIPTQFEDYIINLKNAATLRFYKSAETNTPFGNLIYFLLAQFLPTNLLFSTSASEYITILRNQTFMYLYLILVVMCIMLLYRMHRSVLRNNKLNMRDEVVAFFMVVSYPAIFCIEKGNITGISLMLVMLFVILRNAEKNIFRELSYAALAAAAAITPPALIFALLFFEEKNKKAVMRFIRTVVYFLILFISPAFFNGFGNILTYMKAFLSVSADSFIPGNMSIVNLLHFFGIDNTVVIYAIVILTNIIAVLAMLFLPEIWQKTAAGAYIILNIFAVSDATAILFVFIPLTFLLSQNEHKAINWVYMFTFACLVTPFPEWFRSDSEAFFAFLSTMGIENIRNANNLISLAAAQFLLVILFCQLASKMKARKNAFKNSQPEQLIQGSENL